MVDIFGIVYEMRKERVWMVQTEQQYICIHQASHLNHRKNNANFTPIHSVFWRFLRAKNMMSDTLTKCMTMRHLKTTRGSLNQECESIVDSDIYECQVPEMNDNQKRFLKTAIASALWGRARILVPRNYKCSTVILQIVLLLVMPSIM